jgi:LytS/YehU family sensor histidine kinase
MVLQPFVENAIWHGLMHKKEGEQGKVEVSIVERSGRLCCAIEDNGVGRERANELAERSVLKTKSMGMKITEERLRLLSKQGWEKLINIVDLKDSFNNALGTRVEINFPIS